MACLFKYLRAIIVCWFVFCLAEIVPAETVSDDIRQKALDLASRIENEGLLFSGRWELEELNRTDVSAEKKLRLLRSSISSAVAEGDAGLLEQVQAYQKVEGETSISSTAGQVKAYRDLAERHGTPRDREISRFFDAFFANYGANTISKNTASLSIFYTHSDWFVKHRALYFRGLLAPQATSPSIALQTAQATLDLIPEEDVDSSEAKYIIEAKILSISDVAFLHNLIGNPELSIPATLEAMRLQNSIAEPINGSAIINNLIFAFTMWREHEIVQSLTETLLRLEQVSGSEEPGLTEQRASTVYIQTGNFKKSLEYADQSIKSAQLEGVKRRATLNRIIALVSLDQIRTAEVELKKFESNTPAEVLTYGSMAQKLYHIRALLADARGDKIGAHKYTNARIDSTIQNILTRNNGETAKMLASLQNSKERRDEREASLQRESELKQVALERQQRAIWLLYALAIILAVLTVGAVRFAQFRSQAARKMEIAAEQAKAGDKAKSEFLAVMSHELRTPLNGILGMADIMSRTTSDPSTKAKNDIILKSGNELLALVENIFDMTLIESGDMQAQPTDIEVHDLLIRYTEEWRATIEEKDIIYTVHIDASVPEKMELDRERFRQCIKNLLSNAAKFTDAGRIHVHATAKDTDSFADNTSELTIIVADTGIGISAKAMSRLFKPFVQADYSMTRQYGGAGLGLAITQNLARMMGGDVTVNSRENRGSEFTLTVRGKVSTPADILDAAELMVQPIVIANTNRNVQPHGASQTACFGQKFLIVDDDLPSQNVVQTLLDPTGAHMTCATNGQAALDALKVDTFDVVIMDIRMPGMDGVTAIRRIRGSQEANSTVPIIALTADATPETSTKCLIAGVDVYLTKPVRADDFYEAIEYVNKRMADANRKRA